MGGLFGKKPERVKTPAMPDPEGKDMEEARRRQMAAVQSRSGRSSTVLSGGPDYSSTKLGPSGR